MVRDMATVIMTIRIDAELHERMKQLAAAGDRPIAHEIRRALRRHVDAEAVEPATKPKRRSA